jgi:hypothetical protein
MRDFVAMEPLRVTLTGDRAGAYIIVHERPDGSLVLAPDPAPTSPVAAEEPDRGKAGQHRRSRRAGLSLAELLAQRRGGPATVHEALDEWGIELLVDEFVAEFVTADVDGRKGFVAITNQRLMFVARAGSELRVIDEHPLSTCRGSALVRHGLKAKLRVAWDGQETIIGTSDRQTLSRVRQHLLPANP